MTTASTVELDGIARRLAGDRFDDYAARGLARAYEEFVGRRRRTVAPFALRFGTQDYPNLYTALADPAAQFGSAELRIAKPAAAPSDWEFLVPFDRIVVRGDGSADLFGPDGAAPRRAIVRVMLREHYVVRARGDDAPDSRAGARSRLPGLVGTVEEGFNICRSVPVIPFGFALLLYLADERARYELDVVHSTLLADPRAGRLAAGRRVRRTSRVAWGLDRKLGRGDLSLLAARCLEVLTESNGLTGVDLAHIFGGVRELVESALQALVQQRLATFDPRTGVYRARLEAFLPPAETGAPAPAPPVRPELRTSVQELIAAADARATCPLCGRPLPEGPRGILCDDCAAKVGLS